MFEFIYLDIIFSIFIVVNGFWLLVFVKKIYLSINYKRAAERILKYDSSDYISEQYYYHYQTEISKYLLMVLITMTEMLVAILTYLHYVLENNETIINIHSLYRDELESCGHVNNSVIITYQLKESSIPLLTSIRALSDVADIFVPGLVTCLMSYLIGRMKKSNHINIKRFFSILSVVSFVIVLTSTYTYLIILSKSIYILVMTCNCILFLFYTKRFK